MAKSKQDYYNEGAALARDTVAVANSVQEPMRATTGVSWQAREFAQGFNDELTLLRGRFDSLQIACDAEAARTARDDGGLVPFKSEAEKQADIAMREDRPSEHFGTTSQRAAFSHVTFLIDESKRVSASNPGRSTRLYVKALALVARHGLTASLRQTLAQAA